ncbi:nucleotidyltransferase family protein [Peptococcaceae bacterium]|nr:nucleotidyltransferase family protein [Peptococcaceae bacterium]
MREQKSMEKGNKPMQKISENREVYRFINILRKLKPILEKEFKVSKIGIFGSFIRNEQSKKSDIDILVEFSEPIGLRFFDLIELLEKKLGKKVDLVSKESISPYISPYIEKEVVFV